MFNNSAKAGAAALALAALALAGCNKDAEQSTATPAAPAAPATVATPAAPPVAPTFSREINAPLARGDIGYTLALVGAPTYEAKDDMLDFTVEVANTGKVALVSGGSKPVRLGITLAGPKGVDVAPGKRDFQRAILPMVIPGSSVQAKVRVPAGPLIGLTVRVEPIQEGAGWFGRAYKMSTLDVGTFQRCNGSAKSLCDGAGVPLAAK
jgi:hypothetical protein